MFIVAKDYSQFIGYSELRTISAPDPMNPDEVGETHESIRRQTEKTVISTISEKLSRQYDTDEIFNKTGDDRNPTIIQYVIYQVLYILFGRISKTKVPDDRYEQYRESIKFFENAANDKEATTLPRKINNKGKEESPAITFGGDKKARTYE